MDKTRDLYLDATMLPGYVETENMAKEAVKTVLGILASKMSDQDARSFITDLPEYMNYKNLRGHQEKLTATTPEDCAGILQDKMKITDEQAEELMLKIISVAETENKDKPGDITKRLTPEWRNMFQNV